MAFLLNRSKRVTGHQRGSASLSLLFSTIGGAVFLFSFYNLTEYTAARSGAEQAARRAARCLSPSDPECKTSSANGISGSVIADWYGYKASIGASSAIADVYRYTGSVSEERYSAEYSSYEVNTARHQVVWDEVEIRPSRFVGLLNSYANLKADITVYVQPTLGGAEKECRINGVVDLPAGIEFDSSTYFDQRWCEGVVVGGQLAPGSKIEQAAGCENITDGSWRLSAGASRGNSYCALTIPKPRVDGDSPWLLLGGEAVCDNSDKAPSEDIAQNFEELNQQYNSKGFGNPQPGDNNLRPFPITPSRQFLVVETYSCNPSEVLENLSTNVKSSASLVANFAGSEMLDLPRFRNLPPQLREDFLSNKLDLQDQNSFIYEGLKGVNLIAEQDWTYFKWSREADGLRRLDREVCLWLPWEEAVKKWPELAGKYDSRVSKRYRETAEGRLYYQSGNSIEPEVDSKTFAKAPTCLNPIPVAVEPFTCANREILGQAGSFKDCQGFNSKVENLEATYNSNLSLVSDSMKVSKQLNIEDFLEGFSLKVEPRFGGTIVEPRWEFSWSSNSFRGKAILAPSSLRARNGINPKQLPMDLEVSQLKFRDAHIRDSTRLELLKNIQSNEGNVEGDVNGEPIEPVNIMKVGESVLNVGGAWPFVADEEGRPAPQVRPYVGSRGTGSVYDYDLDCKPEKECSGSPNFSSIDDALRYYANNSPSLAGKGDIVDPNIDIAFTEEYAGTVTMSIDQASGFPSCTSFLTTCGNGAVGVGVSLGKGSAAPIECATGKYVNCYPRYLQGEVGQQNYQTSTNYQLAKDKAVSEVQKLLPLAVECVDVNQPNCVTVNIEEADGEVLVEVDFVAPLSYPFNTVLGTETLLVRGSSRELLESARFRQK